MYYVCMNVCICMWGLCADLLKLINKHLFDNGFFSLINYWNRELKQYISTPRLSTPFLSTRGGY